MSLSNVVAGNQYFSGVSSFTTPAKHLSVSNIKVNKVSASSVVTSETGSYNTVFGYTPVGWAESGAGSNTSLVVSPDAAKASASSMSDLLVLPTNAVVTRVVAVNIGDEDLVSGNYSVGLAALSVSGAPNQAIGAALIGTTTEAAFNTDGGALVGGLFAAGAPALGSPAVGLATIERAGVPVLTVASLRNTVTVNNVPQNPAGALRVAITYMLK